MSLNPNSDCAIGNIDNDLPAGIEIEKMPTIEEIEKLKNCLWNEVANKNLFIHVDDNANTRRYVVRGSILEFKRGNGMLRFLFGIFANANAKLVANLELVDSISGDVVFAGNFRGEVSSWMMPGEEMYKIVAKSFAKALDKDNKKIMKGEKS
jgi:curli biogenesis system outer membrane secretion channel CsgG